MHPARRSKNKVKLEMLKKITENVVWNKHPISWIYNSACGSKTYTEKLWIVDIDSNDTKEVKSIANYIDNNTLPNCNKVLLILKTLNGYHLITKPFDLQKFLSMYDHIDVHKNNPTLIYKK